MTKTHATDWPEEESPGIKELRTRLRQVQLELETLQERRRQLDQTVESKRQERDALSLSIRSLGGIEEPERHDGPDIEVRYQGGDRPTIRIIARDRAEESGGTLRIRDLLRETRRLGFKSDQGGLHTYLKGLEEFIQSGPGEFRLRIDDSDPADQTEEQPRKSTRRDR